MPVLGTTAFSTAGDVFSLVRSLLNDADIPNILTITPTGAVRAGNAVTITTAAAHGLQIGDKVQIASVTDVSFNGTQVVVSALTNTTFTYNQAGANASSGNGLVSILVQGDWATDAVLVPLANAAYRKLQRRMWQAGSKTTTNDVILSNVPASTTQLSDSSTPQLPVDFLAPRELWERIAGSGTGFVGFVPMKQVDAIPNVPVAGYNGVFSWWDETLNFLGATSILDIRLRYFVGFPAISDASSVITVRGASDCIAYWTAFLAATSRGAINAASFAQMFEDAMAEFLRMQIHSRQYLVSRRRPYRGGRSRFGYGFGSGGTI